MRKGVNTTARQVKAVQDAQKLHPWPKEAGRQRKAARAVYDAIQQQRAFDDWPQGDLIEVARASLLIDLANRETDKLMREGSVVIGGADMNRPVVNPRQKAVLDLQGTINTTLRRLGVTVMSISDKRSQAERGRKEREARRKLEATQKGSRDGAALM